MKENVKKIMQNYKEFYHQKIKKIHIIITILSLFLFFIFLVTKIHEFSNLEITINKISYLEAAKENFMLTFLMIFAGITPYMFLSFLGLIAVYNVAIKLALLYVTGKSVIYFTLLCLIGIMMVLCYSFVMAVGMYYCTLSTKKFTYSQKKGFSFQDVKASVYKLRGNTKKIEEFEEKKKKEQEKIERLNVKVPYFHFFITFLIVNLFLLFTTIFIR